MRMKRGGETVRETPQNGPFPQIFFRILLGLRPVEGSPFRVSRKKTSSDKDLWTEHSGKGNEKGSILFMSSTPTQGLTSPTFAQNSHEKVRRYSSTVKQAFPEHYEGICKILYKGCSCWEGVQCTPEHSVAEILFQKGPDFALADRFFKRQSVTQRNGSHQGILPSSRASWSLYVLHSSVNAVTGTVKAGASL